MQGTPNFANVNKVAIDNITQHVGYDLLGPVIHRWLLALHQYIQYLDDGDTAFLFCARAGVRVQKLYQIFQRGFPINSNTGPHIFWISRFSVAKGVYQKDPARSLDLITREYHNRPLRQLVKGLLRHHPDRFAAFNFSRKDLEIHAANFPDWLTAKSPVQNALRTYFEECASAFESYFSGLLAGKSRAVLIDSGWQGSAQSLLAHAYPEIELKGCRCSGGRC